MTYYQNRFLPLIVKMYFVHILLVILLVSVHGKEIGKKMNAEDPEKTDADQIEETTTEGNDYIEEWKDGSGDEYDEDEDDDFDLDYDSEDDEIDNCLQARPKDSKSRDANFWFFYNNETRRCELFRYGGEVTGDTGPKTILIFFLLH